MTITRQLSKLICQALIGVMLLTQLAVAGYACPGLSGAMSMSTQDSPTATTAVAGAMQQDDAANATAATPGCDQIDHDAANLCIEHCRFGQQSADTAPAPVAFAPTPALLYWLPLEPEPMPGSVRSYPASDAVLAAPPPPHAILHCVFRI